MQCESDTGARRVSVLGGPTGSFERKTPSENGPQEFGIESRVRSSRCFRARFAKIVVRGFAISAGFRCLHVQPRPNDYGRLTMRLKFALIVGLIVCCAKLAVAQQQRFGSSMDLTMSRFIDPPRLLRQALRDAEEAIEQKQYSEAVVKLGDLLQREVDAEEAGLNNQDFFLDIKDTLPQRANESFFRHCHDLIGTLPDPARKTYELRYGPPRQADA